MADDSLESLWFLTLPTSIARSRHPRLKFPPGKTAASASASTHRLPGILSGALEIAHGLGANALQIFSSSPRMWTRGRLADRGGGCRAFSRATQGTRLGPLVIHDNYLINLAPPNPVLRTRSVQAFHQELVRRHRLGADYLVAHPGLRGADRGMDQAIASIAQGLKQAARGLKLGDLQILLENTAGQGTSIGSRFEELRANHGRVPDLPLGVCVDTAHLFAAGWDMRTAEGLENVLQRY